MSDAAAEGLSLLPTAAAAGKAAAQRSVASQARKRGIAWALPAAAISWQLIRWLRRRAWRFGARGGAATGRNEEQQLDEEPLEDVLLPPTDRVWELYDEDAVEMLQSVADDQWEMAALMRE